MKIDSFITIALLLCFAAASPASAMLINGGFEEPAIEAGKAEDFERIPGWSLQSEEKATIHRDFEAAEGEQFLELSGDFGAIYQETTTTSGLNYNLDFFYSLPLLANGNGIPDHANSDTAGAFGFLIGTGDPAGPDFVLELAEIVIDVGQKGSKPDWQSYSIQFEAQAASSTIIFFDRDRSGYLIDGVTLAAVPEPATFLLLGFGLVGLAGISRTKFRK